MIMNIMIIVIMTDREDPRGGTATPRSESPDAGGFTRPNEPDLTDRADPRGHGLSSNQESGRTPEGSSRADSCMLFVCVVVIC